MTWAVIRRATPGEVKQVQEMGAAFEREHGLRPGAVLHTRPGDLWDDAGQPVSATRQQRLARLWRAQIKRTFGCAADGVAHDTFGYESHAG